MITSFSGSVQLKGAGQLLTQGLLNINWDIVTHQQERDLKYEKGKVISLTTRMVLMISQAAGTGDSKKAG